MKRTFKGIFVFVNLLFVSLPAFSQDSEKAKKLLDEVYKKAKGYKNIHIDFKYVLNNADVGINQETRGDVTLEGDKYLLNLMGAQQLYDGSRVYNIVPENEEVIIETQTEEENMVTPSKMLTFYRSGHRYEWDILQNVQGRNIQYVKLIPIDTGTEIKSILLGVDVETKHIYKLVQTGKDGVSTTFTVNSFKTDQPLSKTLFTFDEAKYEAEGYDIIRE
ncbi:MAG: outer membrane lipoprotein carrier protein LolA [Bacteroidota bacterium]